MTPDTLETSAVLSDCGPLGSLTALAIEGRYIGTFSSMEEALDAANSWMDQNNCWLDLFYVNDHGKAIRVFFASA